MEPQRLFGTLGRNALRIILVAAVAGVVVGVLTYNMPRTYQAGTKLVVAGALLGNPPQIDQMDAAARLAQTLAELATTRPVLVAALDSLGNKSTPEAIRDQVSARAVPGSLFITIAARGDDASASAALANAVATQLIVQAPHLLGATTTATVPPVSVVEAALPPTVPSNPSALLYGLLAAAAAAFLGIVLVLMAASRPKADPAQRTDTTTSAWPRPEAATAAQVRDPRA